MCPEGKSPEFFRTVGASGLAQCFQHPLFMDSIGSERLLWAPRETKRLQHRPIPRADLMLGIGVPWLQISHFCCNGQPYVSVTPLAGLKLEVFFCCMEDALENKSYHQWTHHLTARRGPQVVELHQEPQSPQRARQR